MAGFDQVLTVAWFEFENDAHTVVTFAECALCARHAVLVNRGKRTPFGAALGTVAAHLDGMHPQLGYIDSDHLQIGSGSITRTPVVVIPR